MASIGRWERFEVEFKADRAQQVGRHLVSAGAMADDVLASLIFGAFDFHEPNGRSELSRRPQSAWWGSLIGSRATMRTAGAAPVDSFERWATWFRQACGRRLLDFAAYAGDSAGNVVTWLLGGLRAGDRRGPVVEGFLRTYEAREFQEHLIAPRRSCDTPTRLVVAATP